MDRLYHRVSIVLEPTATQALSVYCLDAQGPLSQIMFATIGLGNIEATTRLLDQMWLLPKEE